MNETKRIGENERTLVCALESGAGESVSPDSVTVGIEARFLYSIAVRCGECDTFATRCALSSRPPALEEHRCCSAPPRFACSRFSSYLSGAPLPSPSLPPPLSRRKTLGAMDGQTHLRVQVERVHARRSAGLLRVHTGEDGVLGLRETNRLLPEGRRARLLLAHTLLNCRRACADRERSSTRCAAPEVSIHGGREQASFRRRTGGVRRGDTGGGGGGDRCANVRLRRHRRRDRHAACVGVRPRRHSIVFSRSDRADRERGRGEEKCGEKSDFHFLAERGGRAAARVGRKRERENSGRCERGGAEKIESAHYHTRALC